MLQSEIRQYLEESGESQASLSRRAGLGTKAVSDILRLEGIRPRLSTVKALSKAMGRELSVDDCGEEITYAQLIQRLPKAIGESARAHRLAQRLKWLMRAAGWVAEYQPVKREDLHHFFSGTNAAALGVKPRSYSTYKSEIFAAIDIAMPRQRARSIIDISGEHAKLHAAILASGLPKDLKLISGSFLTWVHDQGMKAGDVNQDALAAYYEHRLAVSPKDEGRVKKHVKRVAALVNALARRPEFARYGFQALSHPFRDGRARFGVSDAVVAAIMEDFDRRVAPWALGHQSRSGRTLKEYIEQLDAITAVSKDPKIAQLRRSGLLSTQILNGTESAAALAADGFLLPNRQWSSRTLTVRRGYVASAAKAICARSGVLIEKVEELATPAMAEAVAQAITQANQGEFPSGYAESILKTIVKIAEDFVCVPPGDIAQIRAHAKTLRTPAGMSPRNLSQLRAFTPEGLSRFLVVSDKILEDVNRRSATRKAKGKANSALPNTRFDPEQCRDVMCALIHEIMLVRAPRSANVIGMRLDWIRWSGRRAMIVVPAKEIKAQDHLDPDLVIDLTESASLSLRQYLDKVRPEALMPGDEANPYLFPSQSRTPGGPYVSVLSRLVEWVFRITGVRIHPHLYRHMIGWIWLREDLNMLPTVQRLLGHKSLQTTISYYASIDDTLAMQKWQEFMNAKRERQKEYFHAA